MDFYKKGFEFFFLNLKLKNSVDCFEKYEKVVKNLKI